MYREFESLPSVLQLTQCSKQPPRHGRWWISAGASKPSTNDEFSRQTRASPAADRADSGALPEIVRLEICSVAVPVIVMEQQVACLQRIIAELENGAEKPAALPAQAGN